MFRTVAVVCAMALMGCATAAPGSRGMETVEFSVGFNYDDGYYFQRKSEIVFIMPEFTNGSDGHSIGREWERGEKDGSFANGKVLFCNCRGEYFTRNNRTWFRVIEAHYFFDTPLRWRKN